MAIPNVEEGKLLSEALNVVKIQVQQMKRNLVCPPPRAVFLVLRGPNYHRNWTSSWTR